MRGLLDALFLNLLIVTVFINGVLFNSCVEGWFKTLCSLNIKFNEYDSKMLH